ncbi:hypothetical protein C8R45DRAFT_1089270 [Mycena sanguinolenta]|nr:hypothetical protein C8R45DRAFT_1089270 [Mycena sanguinolenta]
MSPPATTIYKSLPTSQKIAQGSFSDELRVVVVFPDACSASLESGHDIPRSIHVAAHPMRRPDLRLRLRRPSVPAQSRYPLFRTQRCLSHPRSRAPRHRSTPRAVSPPRRVHRAVLCGIPGQGGTPMGRDWGRSESEGAYPAFVLPSLDRPP